MDESMCCGSMHAPLSRLAEVVADEKRRGLWKNTSVEMAVQASVNAQVTGVCTCRCHFWGGEQP